LDECSESYPAEAVDCFEGSIVIKWGGDPAKMKETKQMIKQSGGVQTKSFGPFKLKPKKSTCSSDLLQKAMATLSTANTEECKRLVTTQKASAMCPCARSFDFSGISLDDFDCLMKPNARKTIKGKIESCLKKPNSSCSKIQCRMLCSNGFEKDDKGCDTCKCAAGPDGSKSGMPKMMQQILVFSDHPVAKAFAVVGLIVVLYSMFKFVAQKSEYSILRGHLSYSSVVPEEEI